MTDGEGHLTRLDELNAIVRGGRLAELVQRCEARHAMRLRRIAERVAAEAPVVKLVLVAGPSSAGKTTTAIRLCAALDDAGIASTRLSTDDYFVGAARNPVGADGQPDWETIEAVDGARLVAEAGALLAGESVHLRKFDFAAHAGFDAAESVTLRPGGVVVVEGLHALNPALVPGFPEHACFRVYLNVFTPLTAAAGDAFFADDVRLVRRLVRDGAFRASPPADVLRRWPSVERGEERWINPFRRRADAVFNSALDYELAVLKTPACAALAHVGEADGGDVCREARRLERLLAGVDAAPGDAVPPDSILRETIGGSCFDYA